MRRVLIYGVLGTIAAAVILAAGLLLQPSSGAKAGTLGAAPSHVTSPPIRRCMNMGNALEADKEGDWGYTVRAQDFKHIKRAGFDTVRVPIKFSAHAEPLVPYRISPDFLKRIDQIVDWAINEDLQVIIDTHHYLELMDNPDFHEPRLAAIWEQLSYHYATAPQNVIFELINEPYGGMTIERTDRLNKRLLDIIRQNNKDRWVVVGSAGWGTLEALMKSRPPVDPRVITTFHYYDPFDFTHQGAEWAHEQHPVGRVWTGQGAEGTALAKTMTEAARWRNKTGMPMLLGEFGAFGEGDMQSRARWTQAVRMEAEKHNIGWCYWEWGAGFAVYDVPNEAWYPEMRKALVGH